MLRRIAGVVALTSLALAALPASRVAHAALTPTSATILWSAPGDDGQAGTATRYDVRLSTSAIDASTFAAATALTGAPAPLVASSSQTMILTGLLPSTPYWCVVKTVDDAGNWSGISNVLQFTTPAASDDVRPAPLALAVSATGAGTVSLTWTATGDDSLTGTAARYEVRWSTALITPANFSEATLVTSGVPAPAAPGVPQGCTVSALDRSVALHFAARVADEAYNWSALSNDLLVVPFVLDAAPPAAPSGLAAAKETGGVHLTWMAGTEPDLAGYHVYRATSAGGAFTRVDTSLLVTPSYVDASAPDSSVLWYAVSAVDASSNESAHSAAFRLDATPPAPPSGLAAAKETAGIHLTWTAGTEPDLAGYHVYRATSAGGAFTRVDTSLVASAELVDRSAPDSSSLWYAVSAVDASSNESAHSAAVRLTLHAPATLQPVIAAVQLQPVYPNPSPLGEAVTLSVDVPVSGPVDGRIDIVNSAGERICSIPLHGLTPGQTNTMKWNGRNDAGRLYAPGVYRALLTLGSTQQVVRLVRR